MRAKGKKRMFTEMRNTQSQSSKALAPTYKIKLEMIEQSERLREARVAQIKSIRSQIEEVHHIDEREYEKCRISPQSSSEDERSKASKKRKLMRDRKQGEKSIDHGPRPSGRSDIPRDTARMSKNQLSLNDVSRKNSSKTSGKVAANSRLVGTSFNSGHPLLNDQLFGANLLNDATNTSATITPTPDDRTIRSESDYFTLLVLNEPHNDFTTMKTGLFFFTAAVAHLLIALLKFSGPFPVETSSERLNGKTSQCGTQKKSIDHGPHSSGRSDILRDPVSTRSLSKNQFSSNDVGRENPSKRNEKLAVNSRPVGDSSMASNLENPLLKGQQLGANLLNDTANTPATITSTPDDTTIRSPFPVETSSKRLNDKTSQCGTRKKSIDHGPHSSGRSDILRDPMHPIGGGFLCKRRILKNAIHRSKNPRQCCRKMLTGVFRLEALLECTLTGKSFLPPEVRRRNSQRTSKALYGPAVRAIIRE
ncbi:hypothetical protein QAD02_003580 [Eretmocerus hayati]|uniref:Uncharacterized protein n=1 Tax=Eretmocerus hayati TaxID=131215 RepID=A0ACC2NMH9_9HYME|nr:hypothetical protein QAD02_003580 [Eretmocerus hayati]